MAILSVFLTTITTISTVYSQTLPINNGVPIGGVPGVFPGGLNPLGLGNVGLGGLGVGGLGAGNGLLGSNGLNQIAVGTYQWVGGDGGVYTLYVCSGLIGDNFLYAGIERAAINAFGVPDGTFRFFNVVARGELRAGADGVIATFDGFRVSDALGVDDDFDMVLVFARCDNLYQLEVNDETYTLIKISNAVPLQQQCWRPAQNGFNSIAGLAQFASPNLASVGFRDPYRNRRWIQNIFRQPWSQIPGFNNLGNQFGGFGIWGCGAQQNINTNVFLQGRRGFNGPLGPYGNMAWGGRLLINAFDDIDTFDDAFDDDCVRGVEFGILLDDDRYMCSIRCADRPTFGYSGILNRLQTPINNFGFQQCPFPNLGGLNNFPGFTPYNFGNPINNVGINPAVNGPIGVVPNQVPLVNTVGGAGVVSGPVNVVNPNVAVGNVVNPGPVINQVGQVGTVGVVNQQPVGVVTPAQVGVVNQVNSGVVRPV